MEGLKSKYARGLAAYKHNIGKKHHLDSGHRVSTRGKKSKAALTDKSQNAVWTGTIAFGTPPQAIEIGLYFLSAAPPAINDFVTVYKLIDETFDSSYRL